MPIRLLAGAMLAACLCVAQPANAACTQISTAAQLQAMRNDPAGIYCLQNDINLSSIPNFMPIGTPGAPFTGQLRGNNHVIRNLRVSRLNIAVGLFGVIDGGTVADLTILNASITAKRDPADDQADAGVLAGNVIGGGIIRNVHVDGDVLCTMTCKAGGIAGHISLASVLGSSSAANVTAPMGSFTAGLTGILGADSVIQTTFVTGRVRCGSSGFCAGFVGSMSSASIFRSYSAGPVHCGANGFCGGLVGSAAGNTFRSVYSSSKIVHGPNGFAGGLIGSAAGNTIDRAYVNGAISGDSSGGFLGGLMGSGAGNTVTDAFWDTETTGVATSSDGGSGLTTDQFRASLPGTFPGEVWGITRDLSYPYLRHDGLRFRSPLATLVISNVPVIFLPISHLERSNYGEMALHRDEASLAACYTMIARAIGNALDFGPLKDIKIDQYFWNDATQRSAWGGPVTDFATLGNFQPIGPDTPLRNNVVARMEDEKLVLLRGTYERGGETARSWMLGTLFTSRADGTVIAVVANDPFTGEQVEIDPRTKMVVPPATFPLTNFKVDGFRPVTIAFN